MRLLALLSLSAASGLALARLRSPIVPGRVFDRLISIWLVHQDFEKVQQDPSFRELAKDSISLERYYALTHPGQANYVGAIAGDYFGLNNNDVAFIPENVSTIVDILNTRDVTWKAYMEGLPSPGYMGPYSTDADGNWDYVRSHNPFVTFNRISNNGSELQWVHSFEELTFDLQAKELPQFVFISPNTYHNGHNTSLAESLKWTKDFIKQLSSDPALGDRTLIMLTYDEALNKEEPNHVATLLTGPAIAKDKRGTKDATFYNHYSILSTVEFNWDLPNLGRFDVGSNIFQWVQDKAAPEFVYQNRDPPNVEAVNNSLSYPGPLNNNVDMKLASFPKPNLGLTGPSGQPVLESVQRLWVSSNGPTPYHGNGENYDGNHPPQYEVL